MVSESFVFFTVGVRFKTFSTKQQFYFRSFIILTVELQNT